MDPTRNEVTDVAPSSIAHIGGQRSVVEQVKVGLDAAQIDGQKFANSLLVGPPGCGKSALANVVAAEMATDFCEVLGQSITGIGDLNALLLQATERSVIHIDEAHELRRDFQTALYLALDKQTVFVNGKSSTPMGIPIANFTLLLSTTDEYCLLQPLRDRMKLVLRFQFYSEEELASVLLRRIRSLGWSVHEEILPQTAQRARGTPRLALRLLQSCRRVCRAAGEDEITAAHLRRACDLEQIDGRGLGPTEQQFLRLLVDAPMRLNVIASILGLPPRTVSQVTEPFLLRAGLVAKDDQGRRTLTKAGHDHLNGGRNE